MQLFVVHITDGHFEDIIHFLIGTALEGYNIQQKRELVVRVINFSVIAGHLYKMGTDEILRQYIPEFERSSILMDSHGGVAGGHYVGRETTQKILRASYFYPSIFTNCIEAVKHCHSCHLFTPKARTPPAPLHPVVTVGPFCKWAIDFMTISLASASGHKYIIMAVDYFTKWAEAMPTFDCKSETMAHFFLNHVIS